MMKTTSAMRWKKWRRAGLFSLAILGTTGATNLLYAAQDNKGTDFIVGFLPNHSNNISKSFNEIHLTSDVPTTVTVEYPVNSPSFTKTVSVSPGIITTVPFDNTNPAYKWTSDAVTNNAVHAYANDEFALYMVNKADRTSDVALALPVDVLGTDYIVMSYAYGHSSTGSQFAVYATEDNTTVTITPSALYSSHSAGESFDIALKKRGEGYFAQANVDFTGTIISANKPVGLSNGVACVNIGKGKCDHIFQMAPPVSAWGTTALVSDLAPPVSAWGIIALFSDLPNGVQYRILAAEDGTTVSQDGSPIASTLAAGHFHSTGTLSGNHVFEADKPILVTAFMEGSSNNFGDPAMGNVVPPEQFLNRYTFATIGGELFSEHHLQVTVNNTETDTITLDGSPIGASNFTAIKGTDYSIATISLPEGSHNTVSNLGHGIFVIGLAERNSYLYPGGIQLEGIIVANNTPVAANVNIGGTPVVNSALTVNYTYSDTENDLEGVSSFQWLVASDAVGTNKVAISGATNNTYTPTTSDLNKYITVEVTPVAQTGMTVGTLVEASFVGPVVEDDSNDKNPDQTYAPYVLQTQPGLINTTIPVDMEKFIAYCADESGCTITLGIKGWDADHPGSVNSLGPDSFFYSDTTKQWTKSQSIKLTAGEDKNGSVENILQLHSCYFTDGEVINKDNYSDDKAQVGLKNWYGNEKTVCVLVIRD
jgi:hypothetical protein